jgi:hydrogenase nickel incorporation protein HypA/HybF
MHELALARSLIELVDDYAAQQGDRQVRLVRVRLGQLSAMTRALYFCFDSAARGTRCAGARLIIEEVPLTVYCDTCKVVNAPSGRYNFRCPDCGMPTPKVVTGREMQLTAIELEPSSSASVGGRTVLASKSRGEADANSIL